MSEDDIWNAWCTEHHYDATGEDRERIEGTVGYLVHRAGCLLGATGVNFTDWWREERDAALVRALRAAGDDVLADRIEEGK